MDYYISPSGELYHGLFGKGKGKPRDDHKYIKREWKKGKWVYTYPAEVKKLNNTKMAGKNSTPNRKQNTDPTRKQAFSKYETGLNYNSQKNRYPTENKPKSETKTADNWLSEVKKKLDGIGDWTSDKLSDVANVGKKFLGITQKEEWDKSAVKYADASKKVDEKVTAVYEILERTNFGDQKSVDAFDRAVDEAYAAFDAEEQAMNAYFSARDAYEKTPMGAIDKAMYFAEKDVKDKLGYDERDIRDAAIAAKETIIANQKMLREYAEDLRSGRNIDYARLSEYTGITEYPGRVDPDLLDKMADWYDSGPDLLNNYVKGTLLYAEQEIERTQSAYYATPLGKLEQFGETVDLGKDWINDRVDDLEDWWNDLRR